MLNELRNAGKVNKVAVEVREERKYFLIVSEGERTEPIYFEFLAEQLPKHLVETIVVDGAGDSTINVVKKAITLRDKRKKNPELPPFDEVWAVFDKDDFPDKNYHAALKLAEEKGIECGHSNQSFELWNEREI